MREYSEPPVDNEAGAGRGGEPAPDSTEPDPRIVPLEQFLTLVPPGRRVPVVVTANARYSNTFGVDWPQRLRLHCGSDTCGGERVFKLQEDGLDHLSDTKPRAGILTYRCQNCERSSKNYSLFGIAVALADHGTVGRIVKIGEFPAFGGPLPKRLLDLAGDAADYLKKGQAAEAQGLGIGAFAYYRRFVDRQKDLLFDRIIEVAELEHAEPLVVEALRKAKAEKRFSEGQKAVRPAVPPSLLIRGENPLSLLYGALSRQLHEESDEECLQLATNVRIVLEFLAERLGDALARDESLKDAVAKLTQARAPKRSRSDR